MGDCTCLKLPNRPLNSVRTTLFVPLTFLPALPFSTLNHLVFRDLATAHPKFDHPHPASVPGMHHFPFAVSSQLQPLTLLPCFLPTCIFALSWPGWPNILCLRFVHVLVYFVLMLGSSWIQASSSISTSMLLPYFLLALPLHPIHTCFSLHSNPHIPAK